MLVALLLLVVVAVVVSWSSGAFDSSSPSTSPPDPARPAPRDAGKSAGSTPRTARRTTDRERRSWVDKQGLVAQVREIAETTGAEVGVALKTLDDRPPVAIGPLQVGPAWSTMKVPVILARYRLSGGRATGIGERVAEAITESDNEAASSLFDEIVEAEAGVVPASAYVQQGLEQAGDTKTVVNTVSPPGGFSTYGQTEWTLTGGLLFYSSLARGCLPPSNGAAVILHLMGEVTPSQRWGLGQAEFHDARRVLFKGGWGPDPAGRYLVRQFGIIETANGGLAVALMDMAPDGQFNSGVQILDQLADAVARSTHPGRAGARPC